MLKYLFTARYTDGSVYHQNPRDVSAHDDAKSCFFDVEHGVPGCRVDRDHR